MTAWLFERKKGEHLWKSAKVRLRLALALPPSTGTLTTKKYSKTTLKIPTLFIQRPHPKKMSSKNTRQPSQLSIGFMMDALFIGLRD